MRVRIEAPVQATESIEKVTTAIRNLFPDARFTAEEGRLVASTEALDHLRERIREQRIRDTARRQLLAGRHDNRTTIVLSKQAALVGVVSFAVASPLGDITVEIESDDLLATIDHVAESTVKPRGRIEGT